MSGGGFSYYNTQGVYGTEYTSPVLIRRIRVINDIILPDCAVQETHRDRLTVTDHPVEMGAAITDHAFKEPAEVTLNYGWSNSSPGNQQNSETYDQDMYNELLLLQASCSLFVVITGKRAYNNMLMTELTVSVDSTSEYALMTIMVCKQVILVQTENAAAPSVSPGHQTAPQKTAAPQPTGQQQTQPVPTPPAQVLDGSGFGLG